MGESTFYANIKTQPTSPGPTEKRLGMTEHTCYLSTGEDRDKQTDRDLQLHSKPAIAEVL